MFCVAVQVEDIMGNTHRQCSIEVENKTSEYILCNPCVHIISGSCKTPLPPKIDPSKSGSALFIKTPGTARGSVGVFTYDLLNGFRNQNDGKIAVMFSNPYDFNLYSNWYAVGDFDMAKKCDYGLYKEMYYNAEKGFVRGKAADGSLIYESKRVTIKASMSDSYQPDIKVQVLKIPRDAFE
ncbi:DELTA-sagatoxin-Srs1a-like [Thunnus albacares]|uniref:DELTA-sagatoxin-Srs1a-like n=1 Tax=Thunnus albacares TaxID=8236 RepID=UPI001CF635C8|nr:DELTA-sagatoxin-Srs1a-like [Thunnus albacares]